MANENGNGALKPDSIEGRPSVYIYETLSGVIFYITPISLPTLLAIQLRSKDIFPYPDKEPYQHPEENSFDPNQLSPAEDNPEYVVACKAVDAERKGWADRALFNYCAKMPKYPTREALISGFSDKLKALREIAILEDDDYEAILFNLVLTWNKPVRTKEGALAIAGNEYGRIIDMAIQTVALSPAEVAAGVRFFRVNV